MKIKFFALIAFVFLISGCSNSVEQLSSDELKDYSLKEQVELVVKNTNLIEDHEVIEDNGSVAIVYAPTHTHNTTLVAGDKKDSFPHVATTLSEHLSILDIDELVITTYEPSGVEDFSGLTRVSALFSKSTINETDYEEIKSKIKKRPGTFYRLVDAYLIRDNVWDSLDEEEKESVGNASKSNDSNFWEHYGSYVE